MPANPIIVHELVTHCSLNTIKLLTIPLQGGSHSLECISPLWPPLPGSTIKVTLFYFTPNLSLCFYSAPENTGRVSATLSTSASFHFYVSSFSDTSITQNIHCFFQEMYFKENTFSHHFSPLKSSFVYHSTKVNKSSPHHVTSIFIAISSELASVNNSHVLLSTISFSFLLKNSRFTKLTSNVQYSSSKLLYCVCIVIDAKNKYMFARKEWGEQMKRNR